jgi:hypothetical protein
MGDEGETIMLVQSDDDFTVTVSHKFELTRQLSFVTLVVVQLAVHHGVNAIFLIMEGLVSARTQINDGQADMPET